MALPNPVVVVPGITASDLRDAYAVSPETVWSTLLNKDYDRILLHPDDLRYELEEPARVEATAVFGEPYGAFIKELRYNLTEQRDKPVPVYPFPYDWRQPLDLLEHQLDVFIQEVIARTKLMRHYHATGYADAPQVSLVGHSMGGLIIAGYLQRKGTAACVDKVATLGSPFKGSLEAPIKVITGTASLGPDSSSDSREREASRLTPALYHLLPSFRGAVTAEPGSGAPDDLYLVETWQQGVIDTIAEFLRLHGLRKGSKAEKTEWSRELMTSMLDRAWTHRTRINRLDLTKTSVGSHDGWLCLVGVDATTRVTLEIQMKGGKPFFNLSGNDRKNEWKSPVEKEREATGDGTVPFLGAEPTFLERKHLVCLRPDDFGYWELKDKVLLQAVGFHSLLPGLNLAHRLVVSHLRGTPTKGIWARPAPGVSKADWAPPIKGLPLKA